MKKREGADWTEALNEELNACTALETMIDGVLAEKTVSTRYAAGKAKLLTLRIVRGRRYNPMTGKEESHPYVQSFTFGEWRVFKKNYKRLGYTILEVINDPFGDAADYVTK